MARRKWWPAGFVAHQSRRRHRDSQFSCSCPKDSQARGEAAGRIVFVHGGPVRQMLLGYHYMHFYHVGVRGPINGLASRGLRSR